MNERLTPHVIPGIVLCAVVAAAATAVNIAVPLLSSMLVAIIVGLLVRNLGLVSSAMEPGIRVAGKTVLRVGVVLLGLRLSIPTVLRLGWGAIVVIAMTVVVVFLATAWLGRVLGLPHATTLLTATGTAICGAAAVAGMSSVVRPESKDDDVEEAAATAIASVTLFGTAALLLLPVLVRALGLGPTPAGVWVGASVHEVGQVVAAGGLISTTVLDVAVVAKLGRVVLLAPLVAVVGAVEARREARRRTLTVESQEVGEVLAGEPVHHPRSTAPVVPLFVLGFLVMVLLRSVLDTRVGPGLWHRADIVATFLLTMAMCAMGAGVNLSRLVRTGGRSLLLGAGAGIIAAIVSLAGVVVLVR